MAERPAEPADVTQLIALIDRLEPLIVRGGLAEIEIEAGDTTLILRAPSALASVAPDASAAPAPASAPAPAGSAAPVMPESSLRAIVAPLTGVFYRSPSPGAADYVRVGGEVNAGQVIGLLEAMKLFNEIKCDVTGVVRRIAAESGALVKTKQILIEVEPT
jgi:acetyl-CoA carboxylase biotin carboxyl carrier protein